MVEIGLVQNLLARRWQRIKEKSQTDILVAVGRQNIIGKEEESEAWERGEPMC